MQFLVWLQAPRAAGDRSVGYRLQKLRCNLCGTVFTAKPPEGVGSETYDHSVGSMIALLKYGYGVLFNRSSRLQENIEIPLRLPRDLGPPPSTAYKCFASKDFRRTLCHGLFVFTGVHSVIIYPGSQTCFALTSV